MNHGSVKKYGLNAVRSFRHSVNTKKTVRVSTITSGKEKTKK